MSAAASRGTTFERLLPLGRRVSRGEECCNAEKKGKVPADERFYFVVRTFNEPVDLSRAFLGRKAVALFPVNAREGFCEGMFPEESV